MQTRPATLADIPAITELHRAWDTHWFGAPEHDEDEIRGQLKPVADLTTQSLLVLDGDVLLGAAWWSRETAVLTLPGPGQRDVVDLLLAPAVAAGQDNIVTLDRDAVVVAALDDLGWRHSHSAFELVRPVTDDWQLAEPVFPVGVTVSPATADEVPALHDLIYVDAAWAEIDGHVHRDFDEWRLIFFHTEPPSPDFLVARRDGRPVGVALTRTFSDGTGWIAQLAVGRSERGHGLGRAMLLTGLRARRDSGATQLGLGVQAANANALRLYESVGLQIEREFRSYAPPPA